VSSFTMLFLFSLLSIVFGQLNWCSPNITLPTHHTMFDLAVTANGYVFVSGSYITSQGSNGALGFVARFLPNRTLDNSYGVAGYANFSSFGPGYTCVPLGCLSNIQPNLVVGLDGSVLIWSAYNWFMLRITPNGALDTNFYPVTPSQWGAGTSQPLLYTYQGWSPSSLNLYSVEQMPDGSYISVGVAAFSFGQNWLIAKYNSSGYLDQAFGIGGIIASSSSFLWFSGFTTCSDSPKSIVIQLPRIVVAGTTKLYSTNATTGVMSYYHALVVVSYNTSGGLDTTWNNVGYTILPQIANHDNFGFGVVAVSQPDDLILICSSILSEIFYSQNGYYNCFVCVRFLSSGGLDTTYGSNGIVTVTSGTILTSYASIYGLLGVFLQPYFGSWKVVLVAQTNSFSFATPSNIGGIRLFADGTQDFNFSYNALSSCPAYTTALVAMTTDGTLLVGNGCPAGAIISSFIQRLSSSTMSLDIDPCKICPAGWVNASACTPCLSGYYANFDISCQLCLPGSYWISACNTRCSYCTSGYYQPLFGQTSCFPCGIGTHQPLWNQTSSTACIPCSAGSFALGNASPTCEPCPAGTYSSSLGASSCEPCPPSTYSTTPGLVSSVQCVSCPVVGQTSPEGANSSSRCTCPPSSQLSGAFCVCNGGYAVDTNSLVFNCTPCNSQSYKSDVGNGACIVCPLVGTYIASPPGLSASDCVCQPPSLNISGVCECPSGYFFDSTVGGCAACNSTSFKGLIGNSACSPCPSGASISPNNQPAYNASVCICPLFSEPDLFGTACVCSPGYYLNSVCTPCAGNTYQDTPRNVLVCTACPPLSSVLIHPATSLSACVCQGSGVISSGSLCVCASGYNWNVSTFGCDPCDSSSYKDFDGNLNCLPCPTYATTSGGATAASNCICHANTAIVGGVCSCRAGFYSDLLTGALVCVLCAPNSYKSTGTNVECTSCPTFAHSLTGSTSPTNCSCSSNSTLDVPSNTCLCDAGFYSDSLSGSLICAPCMSGSYKSAMGNTPCTLCPAFAQSPIGCFSQANCSCPSNATLDTGSNTCFCDAKYFPVFAPNLNCLQCDSTSYKGAPGNVLCTACPIGAVAGSAPASNISACVCPTLSQVSADLLVCECISGYFRNSNQFCQSCNVSTYKSTTGDAESLCLNCPPGMLVNAPPGIAQSDCNCVGANTVKSGTSCVCDVGFYRNMTSSNCVPCSPSTFKDFISDSACVNCPIHAMVLSTPGKALGDCVCPSNSNTNVGKIICECDAGFEWTGSSCRLCSAAFWKSSVGDGPCQPCPANAQVPNPPGLNMSQCVCLGSNFVTVSGGACTCDAGFTLNASACVACLDTQFKSSVSTVPCTDCPLFATVPNPPGKAAIDCKCGQNFATVNGGCFCDVGYFLNGTVCSPCGANSYKDSVTNSNNCVSCPTRATVLPSKLPGKLFSDCSCPPNSNVLNGGGCACDPGFFLSGTVCVACDSSAYKDFAGDQNCLACPVHSTVLPKDQPGTNFSSCACPDNSQLNIGTNQCNCLRGYFWTGSICNACPLSQYKSSYGDGPCLNCPTGSQVALGPGVNETDCKCQNVGKVATGSACVCDFGFGASSGGLTCYQCSPFFYKDTQSDSPCLPCPALSFVLSPPGTNVSSCICPSNSDLVVSVNDTAQCSCRPGFGFDVNAPTNPCVACDSQHFKTNAGNIPCDKCVENSFVLAQGGKNATSSDSCICQNRYKDPLSGTCLPCATGGNCTSGFLFAADGYWRPNTSLIEFHACLPAKACKGGTLETTSSRKRAIEGCNSGYDSFMCGTCGTGYAWSGSACVSCPGPNWGIIIGLIFLSIVFVGYIYWTVGAESISKLAIFINYLQLLAQSYFVTLVRFLPLAEFNWITVAQASGSCIFPFTWWELWLFTMMIPLFLVGVVFVFYAARSIYKCIHQAKKHPERICNDAPGKKPLPVNSAQACVMLILFNYLLIAKTSLAMFACVSIFAQNLVSSNYSFACGTSLHGGLIALAVVWLALFCVLLPLAILLRIVIPDRLPKWTNVMDVEFLTIHFRDGCKWWEIVFTLRRLVFAIIVTIISVLPQLKVLIFALFAFSFVLAHLWAQPYNKFVDNLLEFVGLSAIVITFCIQLYVLAFGDPANAALVFVVVLNGLVVVFMLVFLLMDAVPMVIAKVRVCMTNRKRRKALAIAGLAGSVPLEEAKARRNSTILHLGGGDDVERATTKQLRP
jgi:hypothetical protein